MEILWELIRNCKNVDTTKHFDISRINLCYSQSWKPFNPLWLYFILYASWQILILLKSWYLDIVDFVRIADEEYIKDSHLF